jgi:PEP-CTERM motif
MTKRLAIMTAMLFLILPPLAKADEITYIYTGPAPADLSGSFTTSTPLTPNMQEIFNLNAAFINVVSWSFTDGVQTWTPSNSSFDGGAFVNPDGTFLDWNFRIVSGTSGAFSITNLTPFYYQDHTPVGDTFNPNTATPVKGSWTMGDQDGDDTVSTPEPSSLLLLGVGLAALGAAIFLSGGSRFDYIRV